MGTRLVDGRCLVTILYINRLLRFLPLGLSRCFTLRSLERLVTSLGLLFEAVSLFGRISLFGPFVHVSLFGARSPHGA